MMTRPSRITLNATAIGCITVQELVAFAAAQGCVVDIQFTRVSGPPPPNPDELHRMIDEGRNARVARGLGKGLDGP